MFYGIGDIKDEGLPINLWMLSMMQKRIQGVIFGMGTPSYEITRLATMYTQGKLKLDELITKTYKLEDVNQAYADMHAGSNIRGVILHEDCSPERGGFGREVPAAEPPFSSLTAVARRPTR